MSDKKKEKSVLQPAPSDSELDLWRKAIGGQLSVERDMRGLTQEDLGLALGVSQKTISKVEQGTTPNIDRYLGISIALGVPFHLIMARAALVMESHATGSASPMPTLQRGASLSED